MSASSTLVNLDTAKQLTINAQAIIDQSLTELRQACSKDGKVRSALLDQHQWVSFDLARSAAEVSAARHMLEYAERLREKARLKTIYLKIKLPRPIAQKCLLIYEHASRLD